jgi:2-oxoglutarate ferredoxin oxidoreductase subunit beta
MTGGQSGPTTPEESTTSTSPYGSFEPNINIPHLLEAAGASYIARWTTYHVKQMERSMTELLLKKGFGFIEILSPCPTLYQRRNQMGDGLAAMKSYKEHSKTKHGAPTADADLEKNGEILVGKFIDRDDRPEYLTRMREYMKEHLGTRYVEQAPCADLWHPAEPRYAGKGAVAEGVLA